MAVVWLLALAGSDATAASPRFLIAGDGHLVLRHAHHKGRLDVVYRDVDGHYDPQALRQIRKFFRSNGDGREGEISLRLIELLGWVQTRHRPRRMTLMSGYRSPQHNAGIRAAGARAANASLHTEGLAADIRLGGVDVRRIWLDLREHATGGAGYYRSDAFLHVDTGPARFWEEGTSRVDEDLSGGNARVFARTEFDRYQPGERVSLRLHSVTSTPLRVARVASLRGTEPSVEVAVQAGRGAQDDGECIALADDADAYEVYVPAPSRPGAVVVRLSTCTPRVGRTPEVIDSNPIEAR